MGQVIRLPSYHMKCCLEVSNIISITCTAVYECKVMRHCGSLGKCTDNKQWLQRWCFSNQ